MDGRQCVDHVNKDGTRKVSSCDRPKIQPPAYTLRGRKPCFNASHLRIKTYPPSFYLQPLIPNIFLIRIWNRLLFKASYINPVFRVPGIMSRGGDLVHQVCLVYLACLVQGTKYIRQTLALDKLA